MSRREFGKAAVAGALAAGIGGPVVFSGCGTGGMARNATSTGKEEVLAALPKYRVPGPVDFIRTRWAQDPLAFCSYSYLAPTRYGSGIRRMLAEPVGRIVFAGEATAKIPATVHGAIQAGRDAAKYAAGELESGSRVAVVGAGAAGLSCAGELESKGLVPLVLEASDRVGGRVREADLNGSPVELGASWIHGVDGNPLTGLAEKAGTALHPFRYELDFPVPGQKALVEPAEQLYWKLVNAYGPRAWQAPRVPLDAILPARRGPGLLWTIQDEVAQEYGADPDQLAALATWEGDWLEGGDALLDGPYSQILEPLSGEAEIRFGFKVDRIAQDSGTVTLSGGGKAVEAKAAVITVPIGVLKAGTIRFSPTLPVRTRTAIAGLGAGLLDKVWLAFDEPFWDEKAEGFSWIDPAFPGRWGAWVNMIPVTGQPFLLTLSGGRDARYLSGRGDLEIVTGAMRALEAMFGSST